MRPFLTLIVAAIALAAAGCAVPSVHPTPNAALNDPAAVRSESATSNKQRRIEAEKANCPQIANSKITESAIQTNMRTAHRTREEALSYLRQLQIELCQRRAEMTPSDRAMVDYYIEKAEREAREELQTEAKLKRDGWHVARYGVRPGTGCGYITYARTLWEKCP